MKQAFHIWTMQMSNWRIAQSCGIKLLDITVKSGIQAFAPTWENLRAYKEGRMTQTEYTERYYDKVLADVEFSQKEWSKLTENQSVALTCYCRAGDYCHRHLFAPLAITYLQHLGRVVEFHGELLQVTAR